MRRWEPGKPYLLGYSQQLSVDAGDTIDVRVSTQTTSYRADLVRLRHGDESPAGPGFRQSPVEEVGFREVAGRIQPTPLGSVIRVPPTTFLDVDHLGLSLWFLPTLLGGEQHLVSWLDDAGNGIEIVLGPEGELQGRIGSDPPHLSAGLVQSGIWHLVSLSLDRALGSARLSVHTRPRQPLAARSREASTAVTLDTWDAAGAPIMIGGQSLPQPGTPPEVTWIGTLFGRVADLALWAGAPEEGGGRPDPGDDRLVAFWDFGLDPRSDLCRDVGPHAHHGRLLNGGTRLVTGPDFGDADQRPDPLTHNAIHLHADEVLAAGWDSDLEVQLPTSLESGVYAIRLSDPDGGLEDHVPLFVRGSSRGHQIAVLFPTYTYVAYGNERMNFGTIQLPDAERADRLQPVDTLIEANLWLGRSLYDEHLDRSGFTRVSRHRALVTMRPEHRSWLSGGPRHLSADLCLIDWLEEHRYGYDVLTDEDLHVGGIDVLAGYQVVLTGSHPEYVTGAMLDSLTEFVADGGRLMYLGGNGYYWVTSVDPERADVIEVRRGYAGSRTWESAPGDDYHSTTLERGGLWRHRGRPPNYLVGVGFAASGWGGKAGAFHVTQPVPARAAFVFDGLDLDEPIGDFGLIMNGCVGDEVDRWDPRCGSPSDAIRLATCTDLNDSYVIVVEDTIGTGTDITSATNTAVRADMVLLPSSKGGAVFSVGSMAWVGSLSHSGYNNSVSRVTKNVLERFLERAPI